MIPSWLPNKFYVIGNAQIYNGEYSIGAFVTCRNNVWPIDISAKDLALLQNNFKGKVSNIGACRILLKK